MSRNVKRIYWIDDSWASLTPSIEEDIHYLLHQLCERFAVVQLHLEKFGRVYHLGNSSRRFYSCPRRSRFHWLPDFGHLQDDEKYEICCHARPWAPRCFFDVSLAIVDGDLGDGDYSDNGSSGRFINTVLKPENIPYLRYSGALEERFPSSLLGLRHIQKPDLDQLVDSMIRNGFSA